ncbi:hypothetical protein MNBD_GAMMA21-1009 [hydrothermal vent metagenome]|uniref:HEAT repeat domain-containing protein n=1 Tax=hydrothermal vent metagenome TaxID=652676 RepID=A0A3B1A8H6_9ZZZZ
MQTDLRILVLIGLSSGLLTACTLVSVNPPPTKPERKPISIEQSDVAVTDEVVAAEIKQLKTPREVRNKILRLYHPDPVERAWAAYQLAKLGRGAAPAVPYLIKLLDDDSSVLLSRYIGSGFRSSSDTTPAEEASRSLARIGDPAIKDLLDALKSESVNVRRLAAKALGQIGSSQTIGELINLLTDESRKVQASAAIALGNYRHPIASQKITEAFASVSPQVRVHLVYALSRINDIIAVPFLIKQLPKQTPEVRASIVLALGKLRDARAIESILLAANDRDDIVRANAAYALGSFYSPQTMNSLIAALDDPIERVREGASEALVHLTGMNFGTSKSQWSGWWQQQQAGMIQNKGIKNKK